MVWRNVQEITTNLVPFPKLHYLLSSLTPLYSLGNNNIQPRTWIFLEFSPKISRSFCTKCICTVGNFGGKMRDYRLDQMFTEAFAKEYQIIRSGESFFRTIYFAENFHFFVQNFCGFSRVKNVDEKCRQCTVVTYVEKFNWILSVDEKYLCRRYVHPGFIT